VTIVLLIVLKVELACNFSAPALCREGYAAITLKSISSPFTLYTNKTHKSEHKEQ